MVFLKEFFEFILDNFGDFATFVGIPAAFIIAWYQSGRAVKVRAARRQLEKAYLPMFRKIEPFLYKNQLKQSELFEISTLFKDIIDNNFELVNPTIRYWVDELHESISWFKPYTNENTYSSSDGDISDYRLKDFHQLCLKIDVEYDKCLRALKLPTRSFFYRSKRKHYRNKVIGFVLYVLSDKPAFFFALYVIFVIIVNLTN